jgi:hypothetical protein
MSEVILLVFFQYERINVEIRISEGRVRQAVPKRILRLNVILFVSTIAYEKALRIGDRRRIWIGWESSKRRVILREEPRWIISREGKDEEVQCRRCGTALSHWPRENIERFSPGLQLMLCLESTLLRSLSGQAPDPFWVGNVDAETFANLVAELFSLLAEPDRQGVLALADHPRRRGLVGQTPVRLRCGNNRRQCATLG